MGIPKQVEEAANNAEKLHATLFPVEGGTDESTANDSGKELEKEEITSTDADNLDTSIESGDSKSSDEPVDYKKQYDTLMEENTTLTQNFETLTNQHKTLTGKYDAEVPRLHGELKSLKQDIIDKALASTKDVEETYLDKPSDDQNTNRIAELKEAFGPELAEYLDLTMGNVNKTIEDKVEPLKDSIEDVETVQQDAAKNAVISMMDESVNGDWQKDWEGGNPEFNKFLEKSDSLGIYTNGQLVEALNAKGDVQGLIKVLNSFYGDKEDVSQKNVETSTIPKEEKMSPGEEALLAPNTSTDTASMPDGSEAIQWTEASMKQFQIDDRQGKISPELSVKLWDDLMRAPAEGRISAK